MPPVPRSSIRDRGIVPELARARRPRDDRRLRPAIVRAGSTRHGSRLKRRRRVRLPMRMIAVIFGVLIALAGIVWAFQGIGVIPGSFMSNNPSWIWIGAGPALLGVGLAASGFRAGPPPTSP